MKKLLLVFLSICLMGGSIAQNSFSTSGDLPREAYNVIYSDEGKPIQWNLPTETEGLERIIIAGHPPKEKVAEAIPSKSAVILSGVPAFTWTFGCSATAAAMCAGYYDRNGYPNIYTGPTNGGVMPLNNSVWGSSYINGEWRALCPLSATKNGLDGRTSRGHVDDYWVSYGSNANDPYITNGWTQHSYGDCTADFMKTNQSAYDNTDGATTFYSYTNNDPYSGSGNNNDDGAYGFKLFFESRAYAVTVSYNQNIYGYNGISNGFTFANYKNEIDAGRPVLIHVSGHSMLGTGYDSQSQTIYLHDTWDYSQHAMTWGGIYEGMEHYGVTVINLEESQTYEPQAGINNPSDGLIIHRYNQNNFITGTKSCSFDGWANTGNVGIRLYIYGSFSNVNCNNCTTWQTNRDINAGTNEIYLESRQNNDPWISSDDRTITYVKPLNSDDFYCETNTGSGYIKVKWNKHTAAGTNGFHYRVYRNTLNQPQTGSNWTALGAWTQGDTFYDYNAVPGTNYYYWVVVATNNSGLYPSAYGTSNYANLPSPAFLTVNPASQNVSAAAGSTTFSISSNVSWTVSENSGWFYVNPTNGSGNGIINVQYQKNTTGIKRTGVISITAPGLSYHLVSIIQDFYSIQTINLPKGWSGISGYVQPENPNFENIFDDIINNVCIVVDNENMFYPAYNINTLGNWEQKSAYQIKTNSATILEIEGELINDRAFGLSSGWNLMPVLSECLADVADLFAGKDVSIVKEVAGWRTYWPEFGINTLQELEPGKAYFAWMGSAEVIEFPECTPSNSLPTNRDRLSRGRTGTLQTGATGQCAGTPPPPGGGWEGVTPTAISHNIALPVSANSNSILSAGDIIGVFDISGTCYGLAEWNGANTAITTFGNDPLTAEKDGFDQGETMIFKLYRMEDESEIALEVVFNYSMPQNDAFAENGLSAISNLKAGSTGFENYGQAQQSQIVPNPAYDAFTLMLDSSPQSEGTLELYNLKGQLMKQVEINTKSTKVEIGNLPVGVYVVNISIDNQTVVKQLIKH